MHTATGSLRSARAADVGTHSGTPGRVERVQGHLARIRDTRDTRARIQADKKASIISHRTLWRGNCLLSGKLYQCFLFSYAPCFREFSTSHPQQEVLKCGCIPYPYRAQNAWQGESFLSGLVLPGGLGIVGLAYLVKACSSFLFLEGPRFPIEALVALVL